MRTKEEVIKYCMTFPGVYEDYPFDDGDWTCMRIRKNRRIFAWIYPRQGNIWVNVKCDPQWREFWTGGLSVGGAGLSHEQGALELGHSGREYPGEGDPENDRGEL